MDTRVTRLLNMETIEVYVRYDRPLLFACQDALDQKYLVVLGEEEEKHDTWIYLAVSPRRFEMVRSGGIDLFTAFKMPENGVLDRMTLVHSGDKSTVETIPSGLIEDELLPKPGFTLNLPTVTLKKSLARRAAQSLREVVTFRFEFPGQSRTEAPAHVLGEVLTSFQNLVNQIAQSVLEVPAWFSVVGFDEGSFEIELDSAEAQYGLFGESRTGDAMREFLSLMEAPGSPDGLAKEVQRIGTPIVSHYLKFLNSFAASVTEFDIQWASPQAGYGGVVRFNEMRAISIIEQVKQQEAPHIRVFKTEGILKGLSLKTKRFDIQVESGEYHGRIGPEALNSTVVQSAQINRRYVATIEEKLEKAVVTGKEKPKRTLLNLSLPPTVRNRDKTTLTRSLFNQ